MPEQSTTAASGREEVVLQPLIPVAELEFRVEELAREIARDCRDRDVVVVGLLTGAFVFVADVVRRLSELGVVVQVAFVVGYGIDYAERFRELPGIMTVSFASA